MIILSGTETYTEGGRDGSTLRGAAEGNGGSAEVSPELLDGLTERLETFVSPFAAALVEPEQRGHTVEYITGLLSKLDHKTGEGIAYLFDQSRQGIQKFIGYVPWNQQSMLMTLAQQVGVALGEPDGVIVFDPSSFPKKGTKKLSQYCYAA